MRYSYFSFKPATGNNQRDKMFLKKFPSFKDPVSKLSALNLFLLICFFSFFSLGSAWRPSPRPPESKPITSTIKGYIKDKVTNQPISGAEIRLESLFGKEKCAVLSGSRGYYELKDLTFPALGSWYVLKVSKSGYRTEKETKFFSNGKEYEKNKSLMPNKVIPPPKEEPAVNIPPGITSSLPINNSQYLAGAKIEIKMSAADADNEPLLYQFSLGDRVKQGWSSSSNYLWQTSNADTGVVSVTFEVQDIKGALSSKTISCRIINPSAQELLQKVSDNYKKINDLKADMELSTALDGKSVGRVEYCRYYFKAPVKIAEQEIPAKEKTETYSDELRNTITDIIIIDGNYMSMVNPIDKSVEEFNLLEETGISAGQLNNMDIYYKPDDFLQTHSLMKNDSKTDFENKIIALEAIPKVENSVYGKLELYIDYNKGILAKNVLYKRAEEENGELELLQSIETKESKEMANGAWVPVKMEKIPVLSSGNMVSTLVYSNIEINSGLKDADFEPDKE